MFGSPTDDFLGAFDSQAERRVARRLVELRREGVAKALAAHPKVAGVEADFWVQMGAATDREGEIVILEYDGLGVDRPQGLSAKRRRYGRLRQAGLSVRWMTDASSVKDTLTDYHPPNFVRRISVCPECGAERSDVVIGPPQAAPEITRKARCTSCISN